MYTNQRLFSQVCDLLAASVLAVSVLMFSECGAPATLVGSAVLPLFNKKGRLKTGFQKVRLCLNEHPDLRWPSRTPGKLPSSQRRESEALDQKLKQLERWELPRCAWLDKKTLKAVHEKQAAAEMVGLLFLVLLASSVVRRVTVFQNMQASSAEDVHLVFFLPTFDFAVLYSQPSLVQTLDIRNSAAAQGALHINEFRDPEVDYATGGHEPNPCEYKALKLSQALGSDGLDRYLLLLCPNRCTPFLCVRSASTCLRISLVQMCSNKQ